MCEFHRLENPERRTKFRMRDFVDLHFNGNNSQKMDEAIRTMKEHKVTFTCWTEPAIDITELTSDAEIHEFIWSRLVHESSAQLEGYRGSWLHSNDILLRFLQDRFWHVVHSSDGSIKIGSHCSMDTFLARALQYILDVEPEVPFFDLEPKVPFFGDDVKLFGDDGVLDQLKQFYHNPINCILVRHLR